MILLPSFINVSFKRGEEEGYLEKVERILKRWNNAKKKDIIREGKFKKNDVWKEGLNMLYDYVFLENSNNNNPKSDLVSLRKDIFDYLENNLANNKKLFKALDTSNPKYKRLGIEAKDGFKIKKMSETTVDVLNKIIPVIKDMFNNFS